MRGEERGNVKEMRGGERENVQKNKDRDEGEGKWPEKIWIEMRGAGRGEVFQTEKRIEMRREDRGEEKW